MTQKHDIHMITDWDYLVQRKYLFFFLFVLFKYPMFEPDVIVQESIYIF